MAQTSRGYTLLRDNADIVAGANMALSQINDDINGLPAGGAPSGDGGGLTVEQVQDMIASFFVAGSGISFAYNDVNNTFTVTNSLPLSAEAVQDIVGAMTVAGTNVTATYNDAAGTLTIASNGGVATSQEDVQDMVAALLTAGANVSLNYNDAANTLTVTASAPVTDTLSNAATKPPGDATATATVTNEGDIELLPKAGQKIRLFPEYRLTDEQVPVSTGPRALTLRQATTGQYRNLRLADVYFGDDTTSLLARLAALSSPGGASVPDNTRLSVTGLGATITLTAPQYAARYIYLSGTLGQNTIVEFPNLDRTWELIDRTTRGGFTLSLRRASGASVVVEAGESLMVDAGGD